MKNITKITLLTAFLVCSCGPTFDHPLAKPGKGDQDERIYGTWLYVEKDNYDKAGYVHIGFDKKLEQTRIILAAVDPKGEIEKVEFIGHTSRLEGKYYFSAQTIEERKTKRSYEIVQYEINNNVILIYLIESKPFDEAVKSGKIKGEIKKKGLLRSTIISDSPKRIRQFILENEKDLFSGEPMKLTRINAEQVFERDSR